jgi:Zn-dependent protease
MEHDYPPPPPLAQPPPVPPSAPPYVTPQPEWGRDEPGMWQRFKKLLAPIGVVLAVIAKFFAKLKFLVLPVLKFFPMILKTGGTMILSIGVYAMAWGIWFAVGFVLLIFVHECGHLLVARRLGLKVGAPVFIPFMGAFIALKEAPRNAWIESQVGIGGPMLGTLGAGSCYLLYLWTDKPIFAALAYTGFFLNLFNLAPVGFLDGGRIVTALSPWLWLIGFSILLAMTVLHPNFMLVLILIFSVPRLFSLFRARSEEEQRYFEVTPQQRWTMATMYFGLVALLVLGMHESHVDRDGNRTRAGSRAQTLEDNER